MILSAEQSEKLLPVSMEPERIQQILSETANAKALIQLDQNAYYDVEKDAQIISQYYQNINFMQSDILDSIRQLLEASHTNPIRYDPSEYVYPWVDLQPDGSLKSIYSGKIRQPENVIKEDANTTRKRKEAAEEFQASVQNDEQRLAQIESNFKYNCEHVVPQSWFNEREPMRGDIHHLFTCDPACNSMRSNFPYHDFSDYNPELISVQSIKESCGKSLNEQFEPEYGKGAVARAMLYFLLRYPDEIEASHKKEIDVSLLLQWHEDFPPGIYEKHRNLAIYEIQGNRNPWIDYPVNLMRIFQ
ncbi:endonuclease I [Oceanobacillus zhaokaii]|uniref:Endonuclease I n=1 Tax=Oceanobacillus zhaokaii TaxID=2052660 RepID=A0A345PES2_9BACI|nr:endonuclease [Oceanobacillus zhaokaii]AXI08502.1 endonuclease I [Oceanobacillus zhaokaii]